MPCGALGRTLLVMPSSLPGTGSGCSGAGFLPSVASQSRMSCGPERGTCMMEASAVPKWTAAGRYCYSTAASR